MERADVVVVGGGTSGLVSAICSARAGDRVILLEKMNEPGKKILASGNGRCNLLNAGSLRYYGDPGFAEKVMGRACLEELLSFWRELGLVFRFDSEGRGYPCTYMSSTVLEVLKAELKRTGVVIRVQERVTSIDRHGQGFDVHTEAGDEFLSDRLILAAGGAAQPKLGGGTDFWAFLRNSGHRLIGPKPSLTPLIAEPRSVSGLSGIRAKCAVRILTDGIEKHAEQGEVLFTDRGISGICTMQCSRFAVPGRSECLLNLVFDLFDSADSLRKELFRRRERIASEPPPTLLRGICAPRLAYAVCKQAGLALRGEKASELTEDQISGIANCLLEYRIPVTGLEGFDRAQVMAGGVDCADIHASNLESRLLPGLHITGELLNVDGDCGGFNLMFASVCGLRAGLNGRKRIK